MKSWIILGFALIVNGLSIAQTATTTKKKQPLTLEQRTEKYVTNMDGVVELDDAQYKKVYDARLEKVKKIKEIRDANKGDKATIKEQAKPLAKEYQTTLKGILTETQMEKWKTHRLAERQKIKANQEKRKKAKSKTGSETPLSDDDLLDDLED